jgi:hypothetical protein
LKQSINNDSSRMKSWSWLDIYSFNSLRQINKIITNLYGSKDHTNFKYDDTINTDSIKVDRNNAQLVDY